MTTTAAPRRFLAAPDRLADLATGLEWDRFPAARPVCWADAAAVAAARGGRLPTAEELITLLAALPPSLLEAPHAGEVFWSSSGSPFAPGTRVRAIACEGPARFVVLLLDRSDRARWWGVRDG
jgi:hypothetical protein